MVSNPASVTLLLEIFSSRRSIPLLKRAVTPSDVTDRQPSKLKRWGELHPERASRVAFVTLLHPSADNVFRPGCDFAMATSPPSVTPWVPDTLSSVSAGHPF